jgi:hypothetical protein
MTGDTTHVCVRCGSRDTVPGRFGRRCDECLQTLLDDADAVASDHEVPTVTRTPAADARRQRQRDAIDPLSRCRNVTSAGIYTDGDDSRVEVLLAEGTHGVPITVAETLSTYGLEITDVSPRTVDPVQLLVTAR